MAIKLACLNVKELRDRIKVARLLYDLLFFDVDVAAIQETYFVSDVVCSRATLLFIQHTGTGWPETLLVKRSLGARVDLVRVRLVVADIAVKTGSFRVVAVYAPNDQSDSRTSVSWSCF